MCTVLEAEEMNSYVCVCVSFFDLPNNCNRIIAKAFILNIFILGKETTLHVHSGTLFSPMKEQTRAEEMAQSVNCLPDKKET